MNKIRRLAIILIVLISIPSCTTYKLSTEEFKSQFEAENKKQYNRIKCTTKNGKEMWLSVNNNSKLILNKKDSKTPIKFDITKTNYKNDTVFGVGSNLRAKEEKIPLKNIKSIKVKALFPLDYAYFNIDSLKTEVTKKNDSILKTCKSSSGLMINVEPKNQEDAANRTISLQINGVYTIAFNDKVVKQAVVKSITSDRIYIITNAFKTNVLKSRKKEYDAVDYPISAITYISLVKPNWQKGDKLNSTKNNFKVSSANSVQDCFCKYKLDGISGDIALYRKWLTSDGYIDIKEKNGKVF